jgi:2-polyprenyl-3-methyl-5-hydroxy-6-metoxy-1,4-benzoquinol methylase
MIAYRTQAYERYTADMVPDYERFAAAYRRRLGSRLRLSSTSRCLDLACGYGNFLGFLRHAGVRDFTGVDASKAALEVARQEFGADRVVCADVFEHLRGSSGGYDLISALAGC